MRDQDIREMLYNAEEPVSSGVWSAVAAGLDAHTRVIPFWLWGAVAVAAAAAVAVGVFLWRPAESRLEEFSPASPLVAQVSYTLPGSVVKPAVAPSAVPARSAAPVAVREVASLEAVETATITPVAVLKQPSRLAMPPASSYVPTVEDNSLFNTLAWEARPLPGRDISLTASGNVQASSRAQALPRRGMAAAQAAQAEGLYRAHDDKPGFPFSFGLGVKWNMAPRWAIGTGVRYTNLSRSFRADYQGQGFMEEDRNVDNMQHWIGVPVNVYFDIVHKPRLRVHAFAGGAMDYLLLNKFTIHGQNKEYYWQPRSTSFQWSAGVGGGVEFLVTKRVGLYLDPSVRYYFNQAGGADINGLPVHPVRFVVEGGLRFSLGSY